jgi:hypothetical protein
MPTNLQGMARGLTALAGAAAFSGAQVWAFIAQPGPGAYYDEPRGWFLNSGTSVAMIASAIAIAAALAAIARGDSPWITAGAIAVGGCFAMLVVLATIGMGNLFPIVLIMGGTIVCGAAVCGSLVGYGARQLAGLADAND